jgi:hypothetical protein
VKRKKAMLDDALVSGVERPSGQRTVEREGLDQSGGSGLSFAQRLAERRIHVKRPCAAPQEQPQHHHHCDSRFLHGIALLMRAVAGIKKRPFGPS